MESHQRSLSPRKNALEPIFANHVAFLDAHRGEILRVPGAIALDGAAPFLSFWSPLSPAAEHPTDGRAIWLYPWSGPGWAKRLEGLGYAPAEQLSYMKLEDAAPRREAVVGGVSIVAGASAARAFAAVQARGFLTGSSPHRDFWAALFERMALANYADPDQRFFLARVGGKPAAVLLTVRTGRVTGIYAVATDPEYRNLGLSSLLLRHAWERAGERGAGTLVLQAMADQYARLFYQRAGFVERYRCQVWRRQ